MLKEPKVKSKVNILAIAIFYIVAISLRYLTNKTPVIDGITNPFLKTVLHAIGPAVGALLVFVIFKIKPVLSLKGNYKTLVFPFLIYWIFPIILISTAAYFTNGNFPALTVASILVYGLLEELGWRGFLQQELKSLPNILNILIVTILWFCWHLNFDFTTSNLVFLAVLFLGSWGIGKVSDSTSSLLAVSAFHSLNNFFGNLDSTKIILLVTFLVVWITLLVVRKRRSAKES